MDDKRRIFLEITKVLSQDCEIIEKFQQNTQSEYFYGFFFSFHHSNQFMEKNFHHRLINEKIFSAKNFHFN